MDGLYQIYSDNLTAVYSLVKPQILPGMSEEQIIDIIRGCADQLFQIHQENDRILQEILFSKTADTLTSQEAQQLIELADILFHYNRSPDIGIAYRIHRLLRAYAEYHHDIDLTIRELYHQGITAMYLGVRAPNKGIDMLVEEIWECFSAGASYLSQYEELTNSQTRGYIIRCLGNLKYGIQSFRGYNDGRPLINLCDSWGEYMKCFQQTMDIVQSPDYRQKNPEIPWDNFIYTMHYDRTQFLTGLRGKPDPDIARAVMESAEYVYRHQEQIAKSQEKGIGVRTQYTYAAARYHASLCNIGELLETLFFICEQADIHDFSSDTIWAILYTPGYLMYYSKILPDEQQKEIRPRLTRALDKQKEYLFLLPRNEYASQVSRTLQTVTAYVSTDDTQFYLRILDYFLACHPPTFVHSKMVALLTRRFCEQMARTNPEWLRGTFGFHSTGEISRNLGQLLELAYQSGLYHDLGKCMLLSYIGLYSRKLLDEEFACIKLHTVFGCDLLKSLGMDDISNAAYYHHCAYDGKGGYPHYSEECPASVSRIVNIITVVDSLDTGTDNIGRSYAAAKTYERLVEELRLGKDSRYDPVVVALLDDPAFYQEIRQFINENRRQVYLDAYRGTE